MISIVLRRGEPLDVVLGSSLIALRPKERLVVAALALRHPSTMSTDQLITLLWPDGAPASAKQSVHNHLGRLRGVAPGLVMSERAGYRLAADVTIDVVQADPTPGSGSTSRIDSDGDYLVEFEGQPDLARSVRDLVRRHRRSPDDDIVERLRAGEAVELVDRLEATVLAHPADERAWWHLTIARRLAEGREAAQRVLDRAVIALLDVGLDPGRRLMDLQRLIRDGVGSADALTYEPFGRATSRLDASAEDEFDRCLDAASELWQTESPFHITVAGPDDGARRELLARLSDQARSHGFGTAFARRRTATVGIPAIRVADVGHRPIVVMVDAADSGGDVDELIDAIAEQVAPGSTIAGVVISAASEPDLGRSDQPGHIVIRVPDMSWTDPQLDAVSSTSARELLDVLAMIGDPVTVEELSHVVEHAAAVGLDLARSGHVRHDAGTHSLDLVSATMRDELLATISPDDEARIAALLADFEFPGELTAERHARRSRYALIADGPSDRAITEACESAARFDARGDFAATAVVLRRVLEPLESDAAPSRRWCELAIRVGSAEVAGGFATGDRTLADVVATARSSGHHDLAALGAFEWCRLGNAAGVGSFDAERAATIDALRAECSAPADLARVGAAAAMLYSLAGDPDRLREVYGAAEANARAANDSGLVADVLPLSYMSLPLHSDVAPRRDNGSELIALGESLDRPAARWEGCQLVYSSQVMAGDGGFRESLRGLHDAANALHERSRSWEMQFIRSNTALIDGDLAAARRLIDETLQFANDVHEDRLMAVFASHHLAASLIEGTAATVLDSVRRLVAEQPGIGAWHAALAMAAAAAGERDEARRAFDHASAHGAARLHRDATLSVALVALGEAAAALDAADLAATAGRLLDPLAGSWSWSGSCTFGPIDITRARLAIVTGDTAAAERAAADAVASCARMRAPLFARQACELLLSATAT